MSNIVQITEQTATEAAAVWLAKMDRDLSTCELEEMRTWLNADPVHVEQLVQVAEVWDKTECLSLLADLVPLAPEPRSTATRWAPRAAITAFASVALALGLGLGLGLLEQPGQDLAPTPRVYETAIGGFSENRLADGSTLAANTNTRLQVSVTSSSREITLERGELAIDVAHDPTRPFKVNAAGKQVEALGTSFSVHKMDEGSIDVTVSEGRVAVRGDTLPEEPVYLEAGQRALFRRGGDVTIFAQSPEEIEDQLAWRTGNLVFRGVTLQEAIDEISRYTPVVFEIKDPSLKSMRIAALVQPDDVDGFLRSLEANFEMHTVRLGDRAIIDSKSGPKPSP